MARRVSYHREAIFPKLVPIYMYKFGDWPIRYEDHKILQMQTVVWFKNNPLIRRICYRVFSAAMIVSAKVMSFFNDELK